MARGTDGQAIEISLPNKLGYERIAMECSAAFARMLGFVHERIEDLKTAISEACLNAMEHGNREHPGARVIVTMSFEDNTLSIAVRDEGAGMEDVPGKPDIEKKVKGLESPRGLGTYLIKQLVDEVEFNQLTNGGHVVRMAMNLRH